MKLLRYIYMFREFILLSLLFITLERLVNGRQLYSFLNPGYHVFVNLAMVTVFFLTGAALFISAGRDLEVDTPQGYFRYFVFIVLIALLNTGSDSTTFSSHLTEGNTLTPDASMNSFSAAGDIKPGPDSDIYNTSGDFIEITKENYYFIVNDIYSAPGKYEGKRISVDGFVYKSKKLKKCDFIIARLIIFCCAADAGIGGFITDASGINESFIKDEWLRVDGVLRLEKRGGEKPAPVLKLESFKRIPADKEPYIYPAYN